jgi:hypothetical protein
MLTLRTIINYFRIFVVGLDCIISELGKDSDFNAMVYRQIILRNEISMYL